MAELTKEEKREAIETAEKAMELIRIEHSGAKPEGNILRLAIANEEQPLWLCWGGAYPDYVVFVFEGLDPETGGPPLLTVNMHRNKKASEGEALFEAKVERFIPGNWAKYVRQAADQKLGRR